MRPNRSGRRWVTAALCLTIALSACSGGSKTAAKPKAVVPPARVGRTTGPFTVALTAGHPSAAAVDAVSVAEGDKLDPNAVAAVVDRLPPFRTDEGAVPFRRPPEAIPRPRVGATIDKPFGSAPKPKSAPTDSGPLRVLRYQPVGDVDIAPDVSVTFSQPMVPIATLAQLAAADVPVKVTPALEGRWRWIGTSTLRFEFTGAVDRLPMATSYRVEVPAGTTSQTGKKLAQPVAWTFRTPPPKVLTFAPENVTVDTSPVFIATFDQRVDPAAVINSITLDAAGTKTAIRRATTAEIIAHDQIHQISEDAPEGRWVAFRPVSPLRNGTRLTISIGPGTPSAEGPRTTTAASNHTATTYSALAATDTNCGYGEGCRPSSSFSIRFNNSLDPKAFDQDHVKIEPAIAASIGVEGNTLTVNAATKSNTRYVVRLPASLRDEFGQTLGAPQAKTFNVGEATPTLMAFPRSLTTTDPSAKHPTVSVTSVGHRTLNVAVYAADPSRWLTYQDLLQRWGSDDQSLSTWHRLSTSTITVSGNGHELTESTIDLSADLRGATGHLVVVVSPTRQFTKDDPLYWENRPTITWVQVTSIGVDAIASNNQLIAWATNLRDGAPLDGVRVRLGGGDSSGVTDADGVARLGLGLVRARYLTATKGNDVALLPAAMEYEWNPSPVNDSVTGFAFDDRGIYRPTETVHVKGWFRRLRIASDSAVAPLATARTAHWSAHDAFGNEFGHGDVNLSAVSGFDVKVVVPSGSALGEAQLDVSVDDGGIGGNASVSFQIQEFRRPEFEVVTRAESAGPHLLTQPVTVAALAQYFSGGVLADAPTAWQVTTSSTTYAPPNWSPFTFGEVKPYWLDGIGLGDFGGPIGVSRGGAQPCCFGQPEQKAKTYTGHTDTTGTHYLQLNFDGEKPDLPIMVSANASVTDVNRQSFASNLELLVHPSTLYVGIRSTRQFVREGEPLDVEAIVTDIDGKAVPGRSFTITAARVESRFVNGTWVDTDVDPKHCEVKSSTKPVSCAIEAGTGGQYKITAVVTDDAGGRNRSEFTRWVSGAETVPTRDVEQESATVVPNQEHYRPGDTADLLVVAPFAKANGLLTVSANATLRVQHFTLEQGSAVVKVPIADTDTHGLTVQVDLAGQAPRLRDDGTTDPKLPPRPAFASASLPLQVQATTQTLKVSAVARHPVSNPGAHDTIDVTVAGDDGSAVAGADVAVVVVDEAVLSLTGYKLADPIATMYAAQTDERPVDYLRSSLVLANPAVFGVSASAPSTTVPLHGKTRGSVRSAAGFGAADGTVLQATTASGLNRFSPLGEYAKPASSRSTPQGLSVRTNFNALALFSRRPLFGRYATEN